MHSESDLRDVFHSTASAAASGIDTADVVRKARARRVPKQLAFSAVSVLAIAGFATLGIVTLPSLQPGPDVASESGVMATVPEMSSSDSASESGSKMFGTRQSSTHRCGEPTEKVEPNSVGLVLSLEFPQVAPANGQPVTGTVVLTNAGTLRVRGTTAIQPIVAMSYDGITVWHSNSALDSRGVLVDLDPGQSFAYNAEFVPVKCGPEDDAAEQFRDNLPPLNPGLYQISAELDFIPDAAVAGEGIRVGGVAESIELR